MRFPKFIGSEIKKIRTLVDQEVYNLESETKNNAKKWKIKNKFVMQNSLFFGKFSDFARETQKIEFCEHMTKKIKKMGPLVDQEVHKPD